MRRVLIQEEIAPNQIDVSVTAADGIALRAWYIQAEQSNGNAVLLLHGLSDNRLGMLGYANLLLSNGYSVLLPDSRAHGASDGMVATYGLVEANDIHVWVSWLEQQHPYCIFGFGESMGAAELLQSLAVEHRFCAVGAESPFSDFRAIAYDRVGQFLHVGHWLGRYCFRPLIEISFAYAHWRYGLQMTDVNPARVVASTTTPVLLIHGVDDSNVPVRHSRFIKMANAKVVLWQVPATDHCGAIATHAAEFRSRLLGWFASHTKAAHPTTRLSPALFYAARCA
jgi:dipeptidyl aminopeptidase/acylaminoacyl peptidase